MNERWLPVVGWEGLYEVSNEGRVRSLDRLVEMPCPRWCGTLKRLIKGRLLKTVQGRGKGRGWKGSGDYHAVTLCKQSRKKREMVHRLVLEAFVHPDPTGGKMDGAHKDGNTLNNHVGNLRWATRKDNMADMEAQHRKIYATGSWSELPMEQVLAVREAVELGMKLSAIQALTSVKLSKDTIQRIANEPDFLLRNFGIVAKKAGPRAAS